MTASPITPGRKIAPSRRPKIGPAWIVREREFPASSALDFGVLELAPGAAHRLMGKAETVAVLLRGRARVGLGGKSVVVSRRSVFAQGPFALSLGAGETAEIETLADSEWALVRTTRSDAKGSTLYRPADCAAEDRGARLAQGACRRLVRTIFDHAARPDSSFVIGEVINLPGRWSSYPPHHHPQPEIYHYRFTKPQGYGHAEIGDEVHRVRSGDTTVIPGGLDHAQVSAPGYGMYYLWIVRHLPGNPYRGFTVTPEHAWLLDPHRQGWKSFARLFA